MCQTGIVWHTPPSSTESCSNLDRLTGRQLLDKARKWKNREAEQLGLGTTWDNQTTETTECNRWVARGRKAAGSESNVAVAVIPVVWLRASRESRPFHRSWTQRLFRSLWNHHNSCEMWTTSVKCGLLENVNNFYEFDDKFGNTSALDWTIPIHI